MHLTLDQEVVGSNPARGAELSVTRYVEYAEISTGDYSRTAVRKHKRDAPDNWKTNMNVLAFMETVFHLQSAVLTLRTVYSLVAQLAEHPTVNRAVIGSNPFWGAKQPHNTLGKMVAINGRNEAVLSTPLSFTRAKPRFASSGA